MKIDTDLRLAIKSACAAQPQRNEYKQREEAERESIAAFFKKHPQAKTKIERLRKTTEAAEKTEAKARKEMCDAFGLRYYNNEWTYSNCGGNKDRFVKAGGVLPTKYPENWRYDAVMAQLASASEKEGVAILKKYGINWS